MKRFWPFVFTFVSGMNLGAGVAWLAEKVNRKSCGFVCKLEPGQMVKHKLLSLDGVVLWIDDTEVCVRWIDRKTGQAAIWIDAVASEWAHKED